MVLLAMADHANDQGESVYPSVARLAWKTGCSERHVQRAMTYLREKGILIKVAEPRYHRPTEYKIDMSRASRKQAFAPQGVTPRSPIETGVTPASQRGDARVVSGVTPASQRGDAEVIRTISESSKNHHESSSQAKPEKPRKPTENQLWVRDMAKVCHLPTKKPPGVGRIAAVAKQYREAGYERSDIMAFAAYWESDPWRKQRQPMSVNILQRMSDFGAWVDAGKPIRVNSGPRGKQDNAAISRANNEEASRRLKEMGL